ncbi:MAG: hypothetical protein ACOZJX_01020 [Pseudomonadota bacterium]
MPRHRPPQGTGLIGLHTLAGSHTAAASVPAPAQSAVAHSPGAGTAGPQQHTTVRPAAHHGGVVVARPRAQG